MLNDRLSLLAVGALVGCAVGWGLGASWGNAEREAIIDNLPEIRAAHAALNADLEAPSERELVCDRIIDEVQGLLTDEFYIPPSETPLD